MGSVPRFDIGMICGPADNANTGLSSLRTAHERALDDFRRAFPNVLMLGKSLRPSSSFTTNAVEALVTLLIDQRRLCGRETHLDVGEILTANKVPEEIQALLIERVEGEMQRRLAFGLDREVLVHPVFASQEFAERVRKAFNSKN